MRAAASPYSVIGAIKDYWSARGGASGWLGSLRSNEMPARGGVSQKFDGGTVYWSSATGAHAVHGAEKGGDATELLTITSDSSSWRIGGLWAAGAHRAVAIVSDEDGSGRYLGTWKDGEDAPSIWLHVASGGLVGSASATRFAWGGGSDAINAEMFVTDWEGTSPNSLGKAPGYARPALSPDGAVVMVPATDGTAPARWTLKRLAA